MPKRRYRHTWDTIPYLDCDHMARWGAFAPNRSETIYFEGDDYPDLAFQMAGDGQSFSVAYQWPASRRSETHSFTHARVTLYRRPCRFGGTRAYFQAPCCGRSTLRLAVLPYGLRCGRCGSVTWDSRRERPLQRRMRKADKIAAKLEAGGWYDTPVERPPHMRTATFEALKAEHAALSAEINREIARRIARKPDLLSRAVMMVKLGT